MLSDTTKGLRAVTVMTWVANYDVKPDGVTLLDGLCKKYMEGMLMVVRHTLERRRTESGVLISSASGIVGSVPPLDTSTPSHLPFKSVDEELQADIQLVLHELNKKKLIKMLSSNLMLFISP